MLDREIVGRVIVKSAGSREDCRGGAECGNELSGTRKIVCFLNDLVSTPPSRLSQLVPSVSSGRLLHFFPQ